MDTRQALQKAYGALAPFSDRQRWEFDNNLVHLSFIQKHIPQNATILDAGCGIGILALALTFLGYKVAGIDKYVFAPANSYFVSNQEKLRAIWKEHGLSIIEKDVVTDVGDTTYDVIVSVAVIEHQRYPKRFMEGIVRWLKPDGLLYVATPNIANLTNRFRFFIGKSPVENIDTWYKDAEDFNGHWHEYTLDELRRVYKAAGFDVLEAVNTQSEHPLKNGYTMRSLLRGLIALLGRCTKTGGDTNIILGKRHDR